MLGRGAQGVGVGVEEFSAQDHAGGGFGLGELAFMPDVLRVRRRCLWRAWSLWMPRGSVVAMASARSPAAQTTVSSSSICQRVVSHLNQPSPGTCR